MNENVLVLGEKIIKCGHFAFQSVMFALKAYSELEIISVGITSSICNNLPKRYAQTHIWKVYNKPQSFKYGIIYMKVKE